MTDAGCAICLGPLGDQELDRVHVWEDTLWRLSLSVSTYTPGFAYLEPKRHIPHITDLDGEEALTFGPVMAQVTSALKQATGAQLVWVYIFGGGIPHLHVHLAPHSEGDALSSQIIRGDVVTEALPSGAGRIVSLDFAELSREEVDAVNDRVARVLAE